MANTIHDGITPNLEALIAAAPDAMARALYEFAQAEVLTESKIRTPVDYGILRDSGLVDQPVKAAGKVTVSIGFGGGAAHYAIYVHEDLDAHHTVGQAKFLESTLNDKAPMFVDFVSASIARQLGM